MDVTWILRLVFGIAIRLRWLSEFFECERSHLATKALLPEKLVLPTAHDTVALFHQHWHAGKGNLSLATVVTQTILDHFKKIPIAAAGSKIKSS